MAKQKEIDIVIDEDGNATAEAYGYKGKGCAEDIAEVLAGMGDTVKSKKKKDYWDQQKVRINH